MQNEVDRAALLRQFAYRREGGGADLGSFDRMAACSENRTYLPKRKMVFADKRCSMCLRMSCSSIFDEV